MSRQIPWGLIFPWMGEHVRKVMPVVRTFVVATILAPFLPTDASDRRPSKKLMNNTPTCLEHYKLIVGILRFGYQFLPGDL